MRSRLLAALTVPAGIAIVLIVLPLLLALALVTSDPAVVDDPQSVEQWARWALVWLVLACLAVGAGAAWSVGRLAGRVEDQLTQITERVADLGSGGRPVRRQGIEEIDRLAQAVTERDVALTRQAATERDLASDVAHQLRTPLTALLMRLEEIAALEDVESIRDEAGVAIEQVARLNDVVATLRSRTSSDVPELPVISLDSVLASLQREYQPAFAAAQRSVRVGGDRGLMVRARPMDLAQIVGTLVENGLRHGDGTVSVVPRRRGPSVVVEICDEGRGIPMAIAPHIFERSVTSRGTGVGLALARDLAAKGGGRLELVRSSPAVFELYLPEGRVTR